MGKHEDLVGQKFGLLTVEQYLGSSKWQCVCSCGSHSIIRTADLKSGHTKSCGCLVRKYDKDESFFEKIDTEEKAYSLGFIVADGNININNGLIKIDQKTENDDVLEKIKDALHYSNTLKHYHQKTHFNNIKYDSYMSRLNISSRKMVQDILKYGITENKSNTLTINFNLIPKKYYRDLIRRLLDGDGCISISDKAWNVNFTSSSNMINQINMIITEEFKDITTYIYHRNPKNMDNATLLIRNKKSIVQVLNWLYKDSKIYQNIKYSKYLKTINE